MRSKNAVLFKVLLNHFHPTSMDSFVQRLPKEEAQEILKEKVATDDLSLAMDLEQNLLFNTHYSWLVPVLQKLPLALQTPAIASFPEPQLSKLKSIFKLGSTPENLPAPLKAFFLHQVFSKWNVQDVLPRQYLPPSPLSALLEFSKPKLVELIDMLAMHDLADALRHIVDKKNLKLVYRYLSKKQQQFLRICLHQKEKITAPRLEIDKWHGNPQKLEAMLHMRGMARFGKGLCGQDPRFIWHLTHILDTGRGAALEKYYREEAHPTVTPYLAQQLQLAMNFLNKKDSA